MQVHIQDRFLLSTLVCILLPHPYNGAQGFRIEAITFGFGINVADVIGDRLFLLFHSFDALDNRSNLVLSDRVMSYPRLAHGSTTSVDLIGTGENDSRMYISNPIISRRLYCSWGISNFISSSVPNGCRHRTWRPGDGNSQNEILAMLTLPSSRTTAVPRDRA